MAGKSQRALVFLLGALVVSTLVGNQAAAQSKVDGAPANSSARLTVIPTRETRQPGDAWAPRDIAAAVPPVSSSASCSLPDVLAGAGKRIQETLDNLERFTATEFVEHQSVNGAGKLGKVRTRKFDYLVSIGPGTGGYLSVHEYRNRPGQFPDQIATEGTPALVLVFHPLYARDFDMQCEGLTTWQGQRAWQVRFEQRHDRKNRLSTIVVRNKAYDVRLHGRAWILADSYQVLRLETDLADTIPAIKLRLEHMIVEYRPVAFPGRHTELWLPANAELYLDFSGRRFYRKHRFTDFSLFSVDVEQQFSTDSSYSR